MSLPRLSLQGVASGLGLGAAFGWAMGGPTSIGIGAMAGLAFAAASARKEQKVEKRPLTEGRARDRRRLFVRGLCSPKIGEVEKLATGFRRGGALTAARALRQHAADLAAVESRTVDEAAVERFAEIVALAHEQFADESPELKAAQTNLDAGRALVPVTT